MTQVSQENSEWIHYKPDKPENMQADEHPVIIEICHKRLFSKWQSLSQKVILL
jgi:hypothetical protein